MDKEETGRAFWAAIGVIYIGGIILQYEGRKPTDSFSRQVIPVDEPTALDWVEIAGILFLT